MSQKMAVLFDLVTQRRRAKEDPPNPQSPADAADGFEICHFIFSQLEARTRSDPFLFTVLLLSCYSCLVREQRE